MSPAQGWSWVGVFVAVAGCGSGGGPAHVDASDGNDAGLHLDAGADGGEPRALRVAYASYEGTTLAIYVLEWRSGDIVGGPDLVTDSDDTRSLVRQLEFSTGGDHILYSRDSAAAPFAYTLFAVDVASHPAGAPVPLSDDTDVAIFRPSPVDERVLFSTDHGDYHELWLADARVGEGSAVRVTPMDAFSDATDSFRWSPDGIRAVFLGKPAAEEPWSPYVADLGGDPITASAVAATRNGIPNDFNFSISRDATHVLLPSDEGPIWADVSREPPGSPMPLAVAPTQSVGFLGGGPHGVFGTYLPDAIHGIDLSGVEPEAPVQLTGEHPEWTDIRRSWISPGGRWLLYLADAEVQYRLDLYAVRLDGVTASLPILISSPADVGTSTLPSGRHATVTFAPDGSSMVVQPDDSMAPYSQMFVDLSGEEPGEMIPLITDLPDDGYLGGALYSPDGRQIVSWLSPDGGTEGRLVLSRIDAGPTLASMPLTPVFEPLAWSPWTPWVFSGDGQAFFYIVAVDDADLQDLYAVDLSGEIPGEPIRINTNREAPAYVDRLAVTVIP